MPMDQTKRRDRGEDGYEACNNRTTGNGRELKIENVTERYWFKTGYKAGWRSKSTHEQ